MEIKVYYECGDVESHQIPEYVGPVYSREEREMVRTITEAHADEVTEVVERVYVREGKGVFLSRWIRYAERPDPWTEPGTRTANHASKLCIVSADRMAQVSSVTVDDDLSDGALPSDVCSTLKGWTGGDPIDCEPKYGTAPVTVSDPTMIVLTNHPLQLAQLEHATKAWDRRLTVVPLYQQYKENPDPAKGELPIIKEFHRLVTEDPQAMSHLLDLALKGVEMSRS